MAVTVAVAVIGATTLVTGATVFRFYLVNRARMWGELQATATVNADRAAIALALPAWSIDRPQIDKVVESVMLEPEIQAVVARAAGRTHALGRDAQWRPVLSDGAIAPAGLLREERAISFGGEPIGSVTVFVTPKFVEAAMRTWLVTALFHLLLIDLTLAAVVTALLWRIVLHPLRAVERYAEAVSSGSRPDASLRGARFRGEVEGLRASIQRMVSLLDARYAELTMSEQKFRTLFNASNDAIFVNIVLESGRIGPFTEVNEIACQRLGWTREELLRMSIADVDPLLEGPIVQEAISRITLGGIAVFESRHRTKAGATIPVEISSHRFDLGGKAFVLSVVRDITHRNQAERAIRALAARLQTVREEEKTRIARDLHDDLGQLLTGLKMDLRWVERRLGDLELPSAPNAILDRVVAASNLIDQTVATVQRIAADLRPSALDRLGLEAALRHEARRFHERTGIPCRLVVGEDLPELRGDAATAFYRISQEALTNVARHAQASVAVVSLAADPSCITLQVEDDGRGIEDTMAGPEALGLLGMKERALALGGDVTFARGADHGTTVTLKVPLSNVVNPHVGARA